MTNQENEDVELLADSVFDLVTELNATRQRAAKLEAACAAALTDLESASRAGGGRQYPASVLLSDALAEG